MRGTDGILILLALTPRLATDACPVPEVDDGADIGTLFGAKGWHRPRPYGNGLWY